jgi:flagellar motility protein MotE (MotC chaperone)
MIKLIVMAVIGLLLGVAGGTGAIVMKHKKDAAAIVAAEAKGPKGAAKETKAGEAGDSSEKAKPAEGEAPNEATPAKPLPKELPPGEGTAPEHAAKPEEKKDGEVAVAKPEEKPEHPATEPAAEPLAPKGTEVRPASSRPASGADAADRAASYKQLARIFGNMKATDAVKVMGLMTDDEVDGVIRQFAPRQAADLLANFPKERAATLSRRLLSPRGA